MGRIRESDRFTFICREKNQTIVIKHLTYQQALCEKSRKFWEYAEQNGHTEHTLENIEILGE